MQIKLVSPVQLWTRALPGKCWRLLGQALSFYSPGRSKRYNTGSSNMQVSMTSMHSHQARLQAGAGISGRRLNTPRAAPAVSGRQRSRITAFTTVPSEVSFCPVLTCVAICASGAQAADLALLLHSLAETTQHVQPIVHPHSLQYKNVAPVGDRVLVKVDSEEQKTSSGLLLPTSAQKKPTQGEIIGAGNAKAVKVGRPLLPEYSTAACSNLSVTESNWPFFGGSWVSEYANACGCIAWTFMPATQPRAYTATA